MFHACLKAISNLGNQNPNPDLKSKIITVYGRPRKCHNNITQPKLELNEITKYALYNAKIVSTERAALSQKVVFLTLNNLHILKVTDTKTSNREPEQKYCLGTVSN